MRPNEYSYIGGSKVPVIMGVSKYQTAVELWLEYCGINEREPEFNEAMRWGLELEPWAIRRFEDEFAFKWEECEFTTHPDYHFLGGHPDGLLKNSEGLYVGIYEGKTTTTSRFTNGVPDDVYWQCQHYMLLVDMPVTWLWVCELHNQRFYHYEINANEDAQAQMVTECQKFWNCVQSKTPPAPQKSTDLVLLFPEPREGSLQGTNQQSEWVERIEELRDLIGPLDEERKALEEQLKLSLGDYAKLETGDHAVYWTPVKTSRFNNAAFKKQHPELHSQFQTDSYYRRLNIKRRSNSND